MSIENRLTKLEQEIEDYKKLIANCVFVIAGDVAIVLIFMSGYKETDGLYMIYACNIDSENCYTLRGNVYSGEGGAYVSELFFNSGGSIELDCHLGDYCYELTEQGDSWDIEPIKRLGKAK